MDRDQKPVEPNMTREARERRRRLALSFDRAAITHEQALTEARAMVENLKRQPGYQPAPKKPI
jgi:hypothetical protein|uniref:hypothetical protein n=1 Tax=uncultured Acidovorax sp. TaxID=158751 RepID=UPI00155DEB6F|nr:hypothetical protein [uncultured Acidovorax sp.]